MGGYNLRREIWVVEEARSQELATHEQVFLKMEETARF